jgi:hypothetical protein
VAALVIGLAYWGRVSAFDLSERERTRTGVTIVNPTVKYASDIEPLIGLIVATAPERAALATWFGS